MSVCSSLFPNCEGCQRSYGIKWLRGPRYEPANLANPIPSRAEWKPLEAAGIEPGAIRELAFLAALNVYYNRLALRSATSSMR